MARRPEIPVIQGDKWRRHYRAHVISLVGSDAPPVSSRGQRFYNRDRWTLRTLTAGLCRWAKDNPGKDLSEDDLRAILLKSNTSAVVPREIVIAQTPKQLSIRMGFALLGGAVHEAAHTCYSRRSTIHYSEVAWILDKWAKVPEWHRFHGMLQRWSNVVEDIRIERLEREEFPGTFVKLHDLQDFILDQEAKGEANARSHGVNTKGALSIVMRTFRDVGLGYVTPTQQTALEKYIQDNPKAVELVLDGPLSGLLRESINLGVDDDIECLRIAFDVVIALYELSSKVYCPSCGARGSKLTITPKRDEVGNKVKGLRTITCTVCGWTDEIPVPEEEEEEEDEPVDDIRFEDPQVENDEPEKGKGQAGEGSETGSDNDSGGTEENDSEGDGGEGPEGDEGSEGSEGEGEGSEGEGEGDEAEGSEGDEGDGASEDGDRDEGSDKSDNDSNDESEGESSGGGESPEDKSEGSDDQDVPDGDPSEDPGDTGGGHSEPSEDDWDDVANEVLEGAEDDLGIKDSESALEEAINDAKDKEDGKEKIKDGEAPYKPYDMSLDTVALVPASQGGRASDESRTKELIKSVRTEASFLRARLRQIVRASEMTSVVHGLPRGRDLSERNLVDTKLSLMGGDKPKRAFMDVDEQLDFSVAVAVEIDESSSMSSRKRDATRMMVAVVEPLDQLGAAVMAAGFRNGAAARDSHSIPNEDKSGCHRIHGVHHDVFKTWDESFRSVRYRFANTIAKGSTPMSDGIQFALDEISERDEAFRFVLVITDGAPNAGHLPVIKRQIRLAKEAGIHVVGVGVGRSSHRVRNVFDDFVHAPIFSEAPKKLIAKLNELVDHKILGRRGRRIAKTG
jgi:hypothetical protein